MYMLEEKIQRTFRRLVKRRRRILKMNQMTLARRARVTQGHISKIEQGDAGALNIATLLRIGNILGFSVTKIIQKYEKQTEE